MKAPIAAVCLVLLSALSASAQTASPTPTPSYERTNVVTNQGVSTRAQPCATSTVMQAGTWYMVSSTVGCQPCVAASGQAPSYCVGATQLNQNGACDTNSMWSENSHGHIVFGPPPSGTAATSVRVQLYGGNSQPNSQGEVYLCNANSGQVNCSPQAYDLAEDKVSDVPTSTHTVEVPFEIGWENGAYWSTRGDGNPFRIYVFAEPLGGSLSCTANQAVTEEFTQEYP